MRFRMDPRAKLYLLLLANLMLFFHVSLAAEAIMAALFLLLFFLSGCYAAGLRLTAIYGVLLALDFMRFSQSRLATIDIYGTFFILLGAYFMLWYCQQVLTVGVNGAVLPMFLGGLAFGLGCASKWTGIYAGAGLAVLYLGVLYARWRQGKPGFAQEFRIAFLGGVVFYVVMPLCIYIASYLPYWWRDHSFGLADWWRCQVSMYNYHSTLEATHPFESRWYTWLLGLRPVWYYRNGYLPYGMKASIAGMAGPVIWLVGLAALVGLLWHQVSGRGSRQGAGVLILYGTQLIPWMLVTRCTFLYHYFPSSMFCLAALSLVLAMAKDQRRARRLGAALCAAALVLFVWYYPALSGLPTDRFCYEGFLPRKHSERVQYLRTLLPERRTIVFYETPHRIADSMDDLLDAFGPNRPMALCRELTKDYEQIRRGPIDEIHQSVIDDPPRGEIVLVIGGASNEEAEAAAPSTLSVDDMAVLSIDRALEDGLRIKDAIAQVVQEHPLADGSLANRKQVYAAVLKIKG